MIIECVKCHGTFNLDENLLKETGSKVRCTLCRHIFTAFPPKEEVQIEEALPEEVEETERMAAEEISKEEDLFSDFDKTPAEGIEEEEVIVQEQEEVGQEEEVIVQEQEEVGQEGEGIEPISTEDLSHLDSDLVKGMERESVDVDEAMDRATKVEEEIIAKKELEGEEEVKEAEELLKPRPVMKKRHGAGLWIIILSIILILTGAVAALIRFEPDLLSEYLPFFKKPLSKEQAFDNMGNKGLSFKDLKYSFVDSKKAGKLFVVKGLVINNYPDRRSFIKIRSTILDSKGKVIRSKIVYAGNQISDKEQLSLSMEEIDNRLRNRLGKDKMNINIPPNSSIPLMIIFSNLPEDITEYTVEPISSSPAGK